MDIPHKKTVLKFVLLLLVLLGYFAYLSWQFDIVTGGLIAFLSWSFFVLCTPVADAGFLLDFPLRLLFGIRMFVSEICVWAIAISLNAYTFFFNRDIYAKTFLTGLFEKILAHPWPYWSIILLSAVGTFLSVRFGDEVMDAIDGSHQQRKRNMLHTAVFYTGLFVVIFVVYQHIAESLGVEEVIKQEAS